MKKVILISVLLIAGIYTINAQSLTRINSPEANSMLAVSKSLIILDVRTPGEFNQGHVKGSINIDVHQSDAMDRINKLDKSATYLVYCRTNNRSGIVVDYMISSGFTRVYQMVDGITGWNLNNLPLEK